MEEYYIGMLHLPMFSGPDDTSVAISGICFIAAWLGYGEFWTEEVDVPFGLAELFNQPKSIRRISWAVFLIYCVELVAVLGGSLHKYWKARDESHFKERFTI